MNQTLSNNERLQLLDSEIANQEPLAQAERAFAKANSDGTPNPWHGAGETLHTLTAERDDLLLQERGQNLNALLAKRAELRERLDRLSVERQVADQKLAERTQHETVQRWKKAPSLLMGEATPWGHSFEIFRPWYLSGRSMRDGAPECAGFFVNSAEAKAARLSFDLENERAAVRLWIDAQDHANRVAIEWATVAEELRTLLCENPELNATA